MAKNNEISYLAKIYKSNTSYKRIKSSLIEQLEKNGLNTPFYVDKVETYMTLWISKKILEHDVEQCLVTDKADFMDSTENREQSETAVKIIKIDERMGKILKELGITPKSVKIEIEDEL